MRLFSSRAKNQFAPRSISAHKQPGRGKQVWVWLLGIIAVLILVGAGWQYAHDSYFAIDGVEIVKEVAVTPDVVPADQLNRLAATLQGTSLLSLDVARLEQEWSDRFPSIERIIIRKNYPDLVEVRYIPRLAYSQLVSPEKNYLVDRSGFIFAESAYDKVPMLLTDQLEIEVGEQTSSEGLRLGLKLVESLRNANPKLKDIVLKDDQLEVNLAKEPRILIASDRPAEPTIEEIEALLSTFAEEDSYPKEVDLRFARPVLRY